MKIQNHIQAKLKAMYTICQTANTFVFTTQGHVTIILDKGTGEFVDGNVVNNDETKSLFKHLFAIATNK